MIFLLLMSLFLLILTENYVAGKKFAKETVTIRIQEYYLLCSVKQTESMRSEGSLPASGKLMFKSGEVSFQKRDVSTSVEEVIFNLELKGGEKALGIGQYDKNTGAMIRWREKK